MSRTTRSIQEATAAATTGWKDETRVAFDKRYVEQMERKIEAFEDAIASLQKAAEEVNKTIQNLDFS